MAFETAVAVCRCAGCTSAPLHTGAKAGGSRFFPQGCDNPRWRKVVLLFIFVLGFLLQANSFLRITVHINYFSLDIHIPVYLKEINSLLNPFWKHHSTHFHNETIYFCKDNTVLSFSYVMPNFCFLHSHSSVKILLFIKIYAAENNNFL